MTHKRGTGLKAERKKAAAAAGNERTKAASRVLPADGPQEQLERETTERKRVQELLDHKVDELEATKEDLAQRNEELHASQADLERERERYEELFEEAPDAYFVTDAGGHIQKVNEAGCRLLGQRRKFLLGVPLLQFMGREDKDQVRAVLSRLRRGAVAGAESVEVGVRRPGKEDVVACLVSVNAGRKGSGEMGGALRWLMRDVSERKQTEAALREREELFRLMFTESSVGKAQADPATGRFVQVNAALCRMTGYSEKELLERTFHEITHPEDRGEDRERFRKLVSGETENYRCEKRYVRRDGVVVWAEVAVNLVRDTGGAAGKVVRGGPGCDDAEAGGGGAAGEREATAGGCGGTDPHA